MLRIGQVGNQQAGKADDALQRAVQIVRHGVAESIEFFIAGMEFFVSSSKGCFGFPSVGDVVQKDEAADCLVPGIA